MVEASPALSSRARRFRRSITVPRTRSSYKVLSADAYTKHGLNAHGVIFDELHAQPNRELWDVMTTSVGSRRQPLIIAITTAGYDRNSICWEQHEYARKVQEGIVDDPSFLGVVYGADEEDDWTDPEVWKKANPNYGVSVSEEFLARECERAKASPAYQNTFRRLFLDQWTQAVERAIDIRIWDKNAHKVNPKKLRGRPCFGGLDLSSSEDLTAFLLVFPPRKEGGRYLALAQYWIPEDNVVDRIRRHRVPYDVWIRDGIVQATPGNVIDYATVRHGIEQLGEIYDIREIAYDRWGAVEMSQRLQDAGFEVVPFGQGFASMSPPTKELLQRLLPAGLLAHGGDPVLRWAADNLVVRTDPAGNLKPDKEKSTQKIDPIVALIMAIGRATAHAISGSIYDERGVLELA